MESSTNSHHLSSIFLFLIITVLLIFSNTTNSISFNFPNFPTGDLRISLENDSTLGENNVIELTPNLDKAVRGSVGRATYSEPIQLWNATTGKVIDFVTHFSFMVTRTNLSNYGDGISFFLAPSGSKVPPRSSGGYLALFDRVNAEKKLPTNQIVAVEFDTFQNPWDPSTDHVGINVNSIISDAYVALENNSIKSGRTANAWVSYNSTTENLSVYLTSDDNPVFNGNIILNHIIDLSKVLPEKITVGFSASTGWSAEIHRLTSWQFNSSNLETDERKAELSKRKESGIGLVAGLVVGLGVLGGVGFSLFMICLKKRRSSSKNNDYEVPNSDMDDEFERATGPKRYSYSELVNATNNFEEKGKLGEGGFGGVYKGFLSDMNLHIAVKRVSRDSKQGKKEYQSEVKIISQLRHRNLVQLIGWCHESNELLLVYEFMPNRSLDNHLFRGENVLTWAVRYKIAMDLASALLYLHEECEQCVVHRDIKSSNIMLDSNFNAKLGDFGLGRLVDHDLGSQTTAVAGTKGYLAPECVTTRKSSKESDVYSFGIVALEIACGRKPVEVYEGFLLVEWVWELYGSGRVTEAADDRLNKNFDEQQIKRLMVLGLWCAHPDYRSRPSATQVINVLKFEALFPKLPLELPSIPPVSLPTSPSRSDNLSLASLTDTLTGR